MKLTSKAKAYATLARLYLMIKAARALSWCIRRIALPPLYAVRRALGAASAWLNSSR